MCSACVDYWICQDRADLEVEKPHVKSCTLEQAGHWADADSLGLGHGAEAHLLPPGLDAIMNGFAIARPRQLDLSRIFQFGALHDRPVRMAVAGQHRRKTGRSIGKFEARLVPVFGALVYREPGLVVKH